ncbi:MAG: alpha/beta hydrolase [Candidatus Fermentibacteraceae bacterium]|nr:alpha/beta hydrolase [Candidatus Fermentibacteraceae bacterium]
MSVIPIISSRKRFYKAGEISRSHRVKLVNLADPRRSANTAISMSTLSTLLENKHVILLIHGYNNTFEKICDAYLRITDQLVTNQIPHDQTVGYVWPGGTKKLSYWPAKKRARQLSKKLGELIADISLSASRVDIIAHSLGCFLTLKALQKIGSIPVSSIYLMAAAVGNYKLTRGMPFANAVKFAASTFIFKSEDDDVLKYSYPLGEWGDYALGSTGPVPRSKVVSNALTVDCSHNSDPIKHSSYSRRTEIFRFISHNQFSVNSPVETKLIP